MQTRISCSFFKHTTKRSVRHFWGPAKQILLNRIANQLKFSSDYLGEHFKDGKGDIDPRSLAKFKDITDALKLDHESAEESFDMLLRVGCSKKIVDEDSFDRLLMVIKAKKAKGEMGEGPDFLMNVCEIAGFEGVAFPSRRC